MTTPSDITASWEGVWGSWSPVSTSEVLHLALHVTPDPDGGETLVYSLGYDDMGPVLVPVTAAQVMSLAREVARARGMA